MSSDVVKEETSPLGSMSSHVDPKFKHEIRAICGENVLSCYQCGECTAGCPAAFSMDIAPNQVMRLSQLGFKDDVLSSEAIWLCAGCETCATRCPRGVALSKVMDACRQISVREGKVNKKQANVLKLHQEILRQVTMFGRVHEISMTGFYKLRSGDFFSDVAHGDPDVPEGQAGSDPEHNQGPRRGQRAVPEGLRGRELGRI